MDDGREARVGFEVEVEVVAAAAPDRDQGCADGIARPENSAHPRLVAGPTRVGGQSWPQNGPHEARHF